MHPNASKGPSRHTPASHVSHHPFPPVPSPMHPSSCPFHTHSGRSVHKGTVALPAGNNSSRNKTYQATSTDRPADVMEGVLGFVFCLFGLSQLGFVFYLWLCFLFINDYCGLVSCLFRFFVFLFSREGTAPSHRHPHCQIAPLNDRR